MKITIDLEPGDLISVHYDDKMPRMSLLTP